MKKILRALIIASIALNLIILIGSVMVMQKKGGLSWMTHKLAQVMDFEQTDSAGNDYRRNRLSVLMQLTVDPADIVFLGDSGLEFGAWHEFLNDLRAKNRALSGDDTGSLLTRLTPVVEGKPRHIVLMCGMNNFLKGTPYEKTTDEYVQIVRTISSGSPGTDLWLLPVLPVNPVLFRKRIVANQPQIHIPQRNEVEAFNAFIRGLAAAHSRIHFVELPELLDSGGELQDAYSIDGLHVNGAGLKKMAEHLKSLGLTEESGPSVGRIDR